MAQISNIKLPDSNNYGIRAGAIPYGEVDATSTATAFTATVPGISELVDGTTVMLRNGQITSASGFTLNINGLGAKPCYNNMATGNDRADPPTAATRDTTIFNVAYTMLFVYSTEIVSGGGWVCYRGYDANTNTIGYQLRTNSGNLPAIEAGYRYRIWLTSLNGLHWVPINTSTSTDATTSRNLNTRVIDPFGPIVYNSTNGTVAKDARPAVTTLWQQYTLTIGYSYVKTLTAWKPVYLKCTPQSSGGVVMNDIVQDLPTSADGKVYIYLGQAYSTTAMELRVGHPVYYYKDGAIRLWSNAEAATIPTETESATTGISIANHSSTSIYGVSATDTSVTGVQSSTTTASHVKSGGNGTAPTLGTAFSIPNVTGASDVTVPIKNTSATTVPIKNTSATSIPNVTAAGSGSFTQGSFNGGSFTQGTDSFTPNTPTVIDTSKFSGGSFTQGTDSFTKPTHASDSFTPASFQSGFYTAGSATTPAVIDTSKFNGGSYSHSGFSGGSFTRGTFSGGSLTMAVDSTDTKQLNITFTAATHANDSFTSATYGTDSFTPASLASGFYTAGTKGTPTTIDTSKFSGGSFTQGAFTQGSFTQGTDSFTPASLASGFYTAGTSASFTQGEDSFTPATHGADSHTHTPPTLGTAISIIGVQSSTTSVTGVQSSTTTASKVTLGTAFSVPNVTSTGSASNWVFEDVTVPIKNTSATTVPVRNTIATTVATSVSHTVTDNGHTHDI